VLPVVKFVNGREEVLLPEVFTADVAAVGICKRLQVCFWSLAAAVTRDIAQYACSAFDVFLQTYKHIDIALRPVKHIA